MGSTRHRTASAVTTTIAVAGLLGLAGVRGRRRRLGGHGADRGRRRRRPSADAGGRPLDRRRGAGGERRERHRGAVAVTRRGHRCRVDAGARPAGGDRRPGDGGGRRRAHRRRSRHVHGHHARRHGSASADIDYARPGDDPTTASRATLVLDGPAPASSRPSPTCSTTSGPWCRSISWPRTSPSSSPTSTRGAPTCAASVERVRALYAQATAIDSIVRLEAELTRRATDLEVLLAIAAGDRGPGHDVDADGRHRREPRQSPTRTAPASPMPSPPAGARASAALFAVVLVLAAIAPFVITALVLGVVVLWIRHLVVRRRPPAGPTDRPVRAAHRRRGARWRGGEPAAM